MNNLKPREKEIYQFIKQYALQNGFMPTIREICEGVGLKSTSSVFHYMSDMQSKGYIIRHPDAVRYSVKGIRYIEDPST